MGPRGGRESKWHEGTTVRLPVRGRSGGPEPPQWRWKTLVKYLAAPVLAGIVLLVLEYGVFQPDPAPPAHVGPPRPWEAEGTSANVAGVQSNGTVQPLDDGSVLVNGTVTDTAADYHGVKLKVVATDAEARSRPPVEAVNRRKQWSHVGLGPGGAETDYHFPGVVRNIRINECVLDRDEHDRSYEKECGHPTVIWPR